jgi:hypothetical protein
MILFTGTPLKNRIPLLAPNSLTEEQNRWKGDDDGDDDSQYTTLLQENTPS